MILLSSIASCNRLIAASESSVRNIPISIIKDKWREKMCPNAERGGWPPGQEIK